MVAGAVDIRYCPFPKQAEFHLALEKHRFVLYLGGRQGGKTWAGAYQAAIEVARNKPPHRGLVVSPTYAMSEIPERDFIKVLEPAITRVRRDAGRRVYDFCNGHTVEFKTGEEPERLRGDRLGWAWLDEAAMMSKDVIEILYPCLLAYRGKVYCTTTPKGKNWLYEEFYLRSLKERSDLYDPQYYTVRSTTAENIALPVEDVARLKSKYDDAFAQQELEAEFVAFKGKVYADFDFGRHVCQPLNPEDKRVERVVAGIDFGFNDPFCYAWIARVEGRWIVVDEHYEAGRPLDYHAGIIRSNPWEARVETRYADYHGAQQIADLRRYGILCIPAYESAPALRIGEVSRLLRSRMADGKAGLLLTTNCKSIIHDFEAYRYREATEDRSSGEKPLPNDNHGTDAVEYALYSQGTSIYHGVQKKKDEPPGVGTVGWLRRKMRERTGFDSSLRGRNKFWWTGGKSIFPTGTST